MRGPQWLHVLWGGWSLPVSPPGICLDDTKFHKFRAKRGYTGIQLRFFIMVFINQKLV